MSREADQAAAHVHGLARARGGIGFIVGLVCVAIGALGFAFIYWALGRLSEPVHAGQLMVLAFVSVLATSFALAGMRGIRFGLRCFRGQVSLRELSPQAADMIEGRYVHFPLGRRPVLALAGLAFMVLVAALMAWGAVELLRSAAYHWPGASALTALSLLLLGYAGWFLLRWGRFGTSICRIEAYPAAPGAVLAAEIEVRCRGPRGGVAGLPSGPVSVEVRSIAFNNGGHESVHARTVSKVPVAVLAAPADGSLRIPVHIATPAAVKPKMSNIVATHWRLALRAPYPGVDYRADFLLPMQPRDPDAR